MYQKMKICSMITLDWPEPGTFVLDAHYRSTMGPFNLKIYPFQYLHFSYFTERLQYSLD